jgi:hypothetical protein
MFFYFYLFFYILSRAASAASNVISEHTIYVKEPRHRERRDHRERVPRGRGKLGAALPFPCGGDDGDDDGDDGAVVT